MNESKTTGPKFGMGHLLATPGALKALESSGQNIRNCLVRHVCGDWGDVCHEDAELNDASLIDGSRILSAYVLKTGVTIWIITEAANDQGHRSATTLLLPEEY